jgi:hypothetical protein
MYKPERISKIYLLIFAGFASLIGWAFFEYYRSLIIEAGCSEIAAASSILFGKNKEKTNPFYKYENIKARCLEEASKN